MFTKVLTKLFGSGTDREIQRLNPLVEEVRSHEARLSAMNNTDLQGQTHILKERLSQGVTLDALLPEAFATVREAAKRIIGLRHFDVQIIGGITLHQGNISEMVTGEGKTLVATLPAYLNALDGKGVHVVTVNDYLARRDSEWMKPVFEFLGMTVGLIQQGMSTAERHVGYRSDITYGTNNEFGFDYLRDNMAVRLEHCVQRELNFAIVDEVDSILIDEARTPLIISGRPEKSSQLYVTVDDVVRQLRKETHYEAEEKQNQVILTDEGMLRCEKLLNIDNLYTDDTIGLVHMIEQALKAHNFFKKDKEYMIQGDEVMIVDEFTGRVMEGRRYSDGLHQALEAKERVPLRFESQTVASITYQNYFRLYNKISGMTGTALTEAGEFDKIYKLEVNPIPTNLPLIREDKTDLIFATELGKFKYLAREIDRIRKAGRPILVGTVSIEKSELIANLLDEAGVEDYQVLNAKHHEREASIVTNAGKPGAITIATNMAGRGTDIKLGDGVREAGGLYIIGTERHESRRIDNQLRGRCGRQGDPGTTQFLVSLEDDVARLFGGDRVKKVLGMLGSSGQEMDDEPLSQKMVSRSIERAQRQVEEHNFEIRKHVLDYDEVMDKQRKYIYAMRRAVLENKDISERLQEMFENIIGDAVDEFAPEKVLPDEWDMEGLQISLKGTFGIDFVVDSEDANGENKNLFEELLEQVRNEYSRRESFLADAIRKGYREQVGGDESKIDFNAMARQRVHNTELMVLLKSVDDRWINHLYEMDYLRESVRLRAFGQRDPLLEFKQEGFELFQGLIRSVEESVLQSLFRLTDPEQTHRSSATVTGQKRVKEKDPMEGMQQYTYVGADKQADGSFSAFDTGKFALAGQSDSAQGSNTATAQSEGPRKAAPIKAAPKVKPNDPCTCGSGKKYKKCCGSNALN